jgi:gluconokinase
MVIVVMGVTASGKSTLAQALSRALGWPIYEGDDFHPPENVEKMRRGMPLDDRDRAPWLDALHGVIRKTLEAGQHAIITCSALRKAYRERLHRGLTRVHFIHLAVPKDALQERLRERTNHFMPPSLLDSQLATLEPPTEALWVEGNQPPETIVLRIREALGV